MYSNQTQRTNSRSEMTKESEAGQKSYDREIIDEMTDKRKSDQKIDIEKSHSYEQSAPSRLDQLSDRISKIVDSEGSKSHQSEDHLDTPAVYLGRHSKDLKKMRLGKNKVDRMDENRSHSHFSETSKHERDMSPVDSDTGNVSENSEGSYDSKHNKTDKSKSLEIQFRN